MIRTAFLLTLLTVILVAIGGLVGGKTGLIIAVVALAIVAYSLWRTRRSAPLAEH